MISPPVDLDKLHATPVAALPFDHMIVPGFIPPPALDGVMRDYPDLRVPGSLPLAGLRYGPAFDAMIRAIRGPDMTAVMAEKFAIDLADRPTMVTVRTLCRESDGRIHVDSRGKLITVLIYMNPGWEDAGGRLRLLSRPDDIDDYAVEVPPDAGTLLAFRCTPNAWHGHKPFQGPRRAVQLNWVVNDAYLRRERRRHAISAFFKKLRFSRSLKPAMSGNPAIRQPQKHTEKAHGAPASALKIETFSNRRGGLSTFKALGHPLAAAPARALIRHLEGAGPVAIYDPMGMAEAIHALYDLGGCRIAGVFVQDIETVGNKILGHVARPVTELADSGAKTVFVTSFAAERLSRQITHLLPDGAVPVTLDAIRLMPEMLTNRRDYLAPLNWATNFAFFRDRDDAHVRLSTVNYWGGYGAAAPEFWCCLFDGDGEVLAQWKQKLGPANAGLVLDSREIRARFNLGPFEGQLFIHVIGAAGHDIVKYALDTYGADDTVLSCTHDANAWPADLYAGLPAPAPGERVVLWVQNSHPTPIPAGAVSLNPMGGGADTAVPLMREIPAFGSYALDVARLLPDLAWPQQIEIRAGKYFVRPRYEITAANGRRRISHPNVERVDLAPDPRIPTLGNLMGKGYLLPAPILPPARFRCEVLPTPMATCQANLPLAAMLYDADGKMLCRHGLGCLPRDHALALDLSALAMQHGLAGEHYGHVELVYDFSAGGEADGWLHGLFRYHDRESGHGAETSFGAHIFNHVLTYRGEPQSYGGPPPGLSTRLFLRTGPAPLDAFCQLIYPVSHDWHAESSTTLTLFDGAGQEIAARDLRIPKGGSRVFTQRSLFTPAECARAGDGAWILVRDTGCRLFGYHGLRHGEASFSLDHMFGF